MQDFNLLGGVAALIVSEGFRGIHWSLTLHGYLWHLLLVLIGLFVFAGGRSDLSRMGYLRTLPVFFCSCMIAFLINILAPGHGQADMFYISPYYPSTQPVFHEIALVIGILPANLLYLFTICLGAALLHLLFSVLKNMIPERQMSCKCKETVTKAPSFVTVSFFNLIPRLSARRNPFPDHDIANDVRCKM